MASFFISHSSRDKAAAALIRDWLEDEGFSSVFLDFDPAAGIPVGREWEEELYSQLRKADVVLYLATAAAGESKWCHAELVMSRSLGRTIVPVQLEAGARHPLVRDLQWVRLELNGPGSLRPLGEALERLSVDPLDTLDWDPHLSPYPGLTAFDEHRAGVFFGRDAEIKNVLEALRRTNSATSERLVFVVGASGSGKSSLLRAGVLPRLRRLERGWVVLPTFAPEAAPLEQLARSVAHALGEKVDWRDCEQRLRKDEGGLRELIRDLAGPGGDRGVLISIDQAEQLATQSSPGDRSAFLGALAGALSGRTPLRAVATLRSEYLSELVAGSSFEGTLASAITVGRLSRGHLCEVIERPAQRAGIDLESGLVSRMVEDTLAESGATGDPLPLLAFTLEQLYERRTSPTRITLADYERVGGVVGALKDEADRTYERLQRQGYGGSVLPALLQLAHVERERRPTGRSVPRARLAAPPEVIDAFIEARLLTSGGDEGNIHVAHEALFSEWPLLRDEITRSQQELLARSQLERDAPEWEQNARDPSYLLTGARLRSARAALATGSTPDPIVVQFVAASERGNRLHLLRTRGLLGVIALVVLAGLVLAGRAVLAHVREGARKHDARAPLVELKQGGAVDEHEVTNVQYGRCVLQGRCAAAEYPGGKTDPLALPGLPVVWVKAQQARSFCAWIGRRLPTTKELRFAATPSAGVRHLFPGWEWATAPDDAESMFQVARNPVAVETASPDASPDTGFRCAA